MGMQPCVAGGIDNDREVWRTERGGDGRWCGGARAGGLGKGGSTRVAAHTVGAREEEKRKSREDMLCGGVVGEHKTDREEKKETRREKRVL